MKRSVKIMLTLSAVVTASAHAQPARVRVAPFGHGGEVRAATIYARPGGASVERILRLKEELKLTDSQVSQLETIRKEQVARRQEEARTRIDLESRMAAGLIERRDDSREQMEERMKKMREESENTRERLEKILTEEQRDKLREGEFRPARALVRPGFAPQGQMRVIPGGRFRGDFAPRGYIQPGRAPFYSVPRGGRGEVRVIPRYYRDWI